MGSLSLRLANRLGLSVKRGAGAPPDITAPSGYAIAFTAAGYTEGTDDSSVNLDVTSAEVGASWALTISSSGGGTDVTDSGTVATASFTISGKNLTGLNPGTLTASLVLTDAALNAGTPATDTATLAAAGYTFTNAEAETVVNAFSVEPDDTRKALIDTLVGSLKTAGVWTKLDLLYVMAAADEQSAKINWIDPGTNDLTNNNSTAFTADEGFTGNGSNMDLTAGAIVATPQYVQNSAHLGVWARSANAQGSGWEVSIGTNNRLAVRNASDTVDVRTNGSTTIAPASTNSVGHFVANRSASNASQIYRNGSSLGTDSSASSTAPGAYTFRVLSRAGSFFSSRQVSFAHIGSSLTGTEVTDTYNAFNTYLSGL